MMKALITGISGQDGSYLAEALLRKGVEVHGVVRPAADRDFWRINHIQARLNIFDADITDFPSIYEVINTVRPDWIFNLAAQSFVGTSWATPMLTNTTNYYGLLNILETVRKIGAICATRIYQASTSEMFGNSPAPQNERTPFMPRSPYGLSKLAAHHLMRIYRESYEMDVRCGILFNHESPRRGLNFVTRKITDGVAQIVAGKKQELLLGNLDARRDWGFAGDYVDAMIRMMESETPRDYVVGTGQCHSVEEFVSRAFAMAGLNYMDYVGIDERYMRPADVHELRADASDAKILLGWTPSVSFPELVEMMLDADLKRHGVEHV